MRGLVRGAAHDQEGWERSDFPIVCETCLGDNPYIRMTKADFDKECKICTRPFTVFRWKPGTNARYKKTEICQTCSKLKNVCQTCLLDLEYGLPVQVRDSMMAKASDVMPTSNTNREFYVEQAEKAFKEGHQGVGVTGKMVMNDQILKLARTQPYYKRNQAHICSFFVKGTCTRGNECPYRHEMPETGELSNQNMKDRYHGTNDPVAKKLLRRVENLPALQAPDDTSITTLYVGGVDERVSEQDLQDNFYSFGELQSVRMAVRQGCAFVTFASRESAEAAANKLYNNLTVNGARLKIMWGRSPTESSTSTAPPPGMQQGGFFPPPGVAQTGYYPSMDPNNQGGRSGP